MNPNFAELFTSRDERVEPDHHFFPRLVTPGYPFVGFWISRVFSRVVEMCGAFNHSAFGEIDGVCKPIFMLPIEIIERHAQKSAFSTIREFCQIFEFLTSHVHVWHHS